ncbi:MAG: thymidylate synthase [Candidatus Campbellbacteria bacterium]|nr:thymidylate synthase [Candidatus Campbellbacteria bacterium]
MRRYLDLLEDVYKNGEDRDGRNGNTRSLFALQFRANLRDSFPALTTKKLAFKAVASELLWFLEGSNDDNRLKEIAGKDKTIWTANAEADYWQPKAQFPGDLGRIYGVQWRSWRDPEGGEIDQLKDVLESIKNNPHNRRHVVTAWNSAETGKMALPPCHMLFQFYVSNGKISLAMTQRSGDMFLGVPFNIASYGLLLSMVAQVCNLEPDELAITINDAHIYHDHFEAVEEQLKREPLPLPKLWLNPEVKEIDGFSMDDFKLVDYEHHPPIKAEMVV